MLEHHVRNRGAGQRLDLQLVQAIAASDVGHFADAITSPLLREETAFDMVERYYDALNARDDDFFDGVLSERWFCMASRPRARRGTKTPIPERSGPTWRASRTSRSTSTRCTTSTTSSP